MDMDFLTDPIFSELGRSDYIGGIDNEALDFGQLDQFMQVASSIGSIDEANSSSSSSNNHHNNHNNNNSDRHILACDPKTESPATPPNTANDSNLTAVIATVSARVGLSSTPIATPLPAGALAAIASHLPESPPDSGSEPPYSPLQDVHGLTLTSRDLYNGLPSLQQQQHHHLQQPQFTPPHQQPQPPQPLQHHYTHSLANQQLGSGIRVKHESGLIMNPAVLAPPLPIQLPQQHQQQHMSSNTGGHELPALPQQQLLHAPHTNAVPHYSGEALYTAVSYTDVTLLGSAEQTASCMLTTSMSEAARVQVIGTTQATHSQLTRTSAPSTPVHLSSSMSRKRKLSTQLDCPDFARIKPDPGLVMNSAGSTPQHTPSSLALAIETQQLDPSSPASISLPPHGHDMSSTPAHSVASLSPALSIVHSQADTSMDGGGGSNNNGGSSSGDSADGNALTPCIRFSPFQPQNWHKLCDQSLQDIAVVYYRVDADKGFNFSVSDDAFVCQKKNHFQITCHARLQGDAKFVKTPSGLEKIKSFHLHFYGVKLEAPNQTIRVEQSQSDRSKKPFYPVPIDLQSHIVSKVTVGRLHFSETTNNNMRKKGRPNPEQRYFQLVVGLHVHTMSGNFPVISQGSERIIVRASNPGQFESDVDLCWQRGITQDSIFHAGRVGINTDRPDESLVVHGNLKISGHIVQPSDSRAKQEIAELDTSVQLRNLQKIRIVRYRYEPEFAIHSGLKRASASDSEDIVDTGVIAQEVREVIPDAVQEAGSIVLPNGNVIEKFLLVNKDRILMENIGAVKELCKVTGSLETRIEHLERVNSRLVQGKDSKRTALSCRMGKGGVLKEGYEMCSNRALQMIIFLLIIVMAACLTAVSTLYFVEHNRQHHNRNQLDRLQVLSNSHYFQNDATQMTEHERHLVQLHNILLANKTHGHWPNFLFPSSTPRPHARNSSKPRSELSYNENGDAAHGRNDELTVVMEKPVVSLPIKEPYKITTTAPLLRNKTISSKNKSKWPLPQVVRALQVAHSGANGAAISEALANSNAISTSQLQEQQKQPATGAELPLNVSESSSEKVADAIPLPQDFENNSIDIDAQHVSKKATPSVGKSSAALLAAASLNDAGHASLASERDDEDVAPKLNEHVGADPIVSTSSSNSIISSIPDTTASARNLKLANGEPVLYSVYRTASPPASAASNYSLEAPAISNKSQGVLESSDPHTADALDLQNLSGNNESVDIITALFGYEINGLERESSLGRRSTSQRSVEWVTRKTVQVPVLGSPVQCTREQSSNEQVSNCQSACFEDSNQLPPLRAALDSLKAAQTIERTLSEKQQQNVESADVDTDDADTDDELESVHTANFPQDTAAGSSNTSNTPIASNNPGKTSHATSARAKQFSAEQQHAEEADNFEAELEHPLSEEHLDVDVPKLNSFDRVAAASLTPNLSIEAHRPPVSDCWKIASALLADGLNNTFGVEDFCPNIGKSLNLTYIVPLSRFFKEQTIELHLSSSTRLLWTICNNHEHIKEDGKHLINTPAQQHQQQEQDEQHEQQQPPQAQPEHYGHYGVNQLQQRDNTSILLLNVPSRGYFIRDLALRASNDFEKVNICEDVGAAEGHETNTLLQYNFRILRDCD